MFHVHKYSKYYIRLENYKVTQKYSRAQITEQILNAIKSNQTLKNLSKRDIITFKN